MRSVWRGEGDALSFVVEQIESQASINHCEAILNCPGHTQREKNSLVINSLTRGEEKSEREEKKRSVYRRTEGENRLRE